MPNRLMLGLWRYIIEVPPFLWQKQIAAAKRRFEKEQGALSPEARHIHHFVVKELPARGQPLSPEVIAEKLGFPVDLVNDALDHLEKRMTFLYRNAEGHVAWAYPVTVDETPHRITFGSGEKVYAAWAADAIATPFVQGRLRNQYLTVQIETACAHCARPMSIAIDSNLSYRTMDETCRPVIFVPDVDLYNLAEDSIIDSFWVQCVFFWSEEHARTYRKKTHRIRGAYMKAEQMVQVTRIMQSAIFGFDDTACTRRS